jgi:hypothetical protein
VRHIKAHHDNDLGLWPLSVNALDDLGQGVDVGGGGDIVGFVVVVCADVDDNNVSSRVLTEVPWLRLVYTAWVNRTS